MLPPSIHIDPQFVILRDSEGSPIAQNKNIRDEILRLSAQNDKRAIRESPLQPVGNGLDRSANRPVYGEVARAKRVTEGQITSKSTGGQGAPVFGQVTSAALLPYTMSKKADFPEKGVIVSLTELCYYANSNRTFVLFCLRKRGAP